MLRRRRSSYRVGAATLWVPLYMLGFMALALVLVLTQPGLGGGGNAPPAFVVLLVLHLFTMLVMFALLAVYLVDVFRYPDLAESRTCGSCGWCS